MAEAFLRDSILDLKDLHDPEKEELNKQKRLQQQMTKKAPIRRKDSLV